MSLCNMSIYLSIMIYNTDYQSINSPELRQAALRLFHPLLTVHDLFLDIKVAVLVVLEELRHRVLLLLPQPGLGRGAGPRVLPAHAETVVIPPADSRDVLRESSHFLE